MINVSQSTSRGSAISVDIKVIQKEVAEVVNERFDELEKNGLMETKVLETEIAQAVSKYFDDLEETLLFEEIEKLEESVEELIKRYIKDVILKRFPENCSKLKDDVLAAFNRSCSTISQTTKFQQIIEKLQKEVTEAIYRSCDNGKKCLILDGNADLKKKVTDCVQCYFEDNDETKEGFENVQFTVTETILGFLKDIEEKHMKMGITKLEKELLEAINSYFEDLG